VSKDIYETLADPIRMKIALAIASRGKATTHEICEALKESIPEDEVRENIRILIDVGALLIFDDGIDATLSLDAEGLRKHITPKAIYDYVAGPSAYALQSLYNN